MGEQATSNFDKPFGDGLLHKHSVRLKKFINTNLLWARFELGSQGSKAIVLPIKPPLLVNSDKSSKKQTCKKHLQFKWLIAQSSEISSQAIFFL